MIRSHPDYLQKGHIYFQTPSLRRQAFDFLEERLRENVREKRPDGAASLLTEVQGFLKREPSLAVRHVDEGLVQEAEGFFMRNVEALLKLCALTKDPWERFHTLSLIARFLPEIEEKQGGIRSSHLVQGYLLLIHTLSRPDVFLKDPEGKEWKGCFMLAVKALYRWDGLDILKTWNTVPDLIASIIKDIPEEGKKRQEPLLRNSARIAARISHERDGTPEDMLALFFSSALLIAARLRLLRDEKRDLLHELWTRKRIEVISSLRDQYGRLLGEEPSGLGPVETFIAGRLGEAWRAEELLGKAMDGSPKGIKPMAFFSQITGSSGGDVFSEEDLEIIRRLSSTGPKVS